VEQEGVTMARRKRFCDGAGFTQHCWECIHAKDWHEGFGYVKCATCEVYDMTVEKTDCPNNGSSYIGKICWSYER
jgi:hypothetical protein